MSQRKNIGAAVETPEESFRKRIADPARVTARETMGAENKEDMKRVNVNFSMSAYRTLEELAVTKHKSMADVLRDAIQLEKWLTDARSEGWHVLLERDGRVRELVTF